MRYSYTNVSTFAQCPYRWKLQYKDRLKVIPDTEPDNALWLGLGLHKGVEEWSVQDGLDEYKSHYNILTDKNINWMIQLEYQLTKFLDILPKGGEHEVEISLPTFVGYVDYICGDTMFDFKFSNNIGNYLHSPQLSIYKHYLSVVRPDIQINHIKFCFIPKINIRQKKDESLFEFRKRLQEHLEASEIKIIEVSYDESSISRFEDCCNELDTITNFPKNETKLCSWCQYEALCKRGEDWMIL